MVITPRRTGEVYAHAQDLPDQVRLQPQDQPRRPGGELSAMGARLRTSHRCGTRDLEGSVGARR